MPNKRKPPMDAAVYSISEIASLLNVSLPSAYAMARSERFPAFSIGKRILVPKVAFDRWLSGIEPGQQFPSYRQSPT
ncbi:MAG: hypothetical protein DDT37_01955 [Firmicutes bacterium]|nr:hypothetical protein [candidate division NPL-UPA2 bacterium]